MNKPKLRLIELFNGISAQYRGIVNTDLFDCEMVATSDIDHNVIVECAAIHCGLTNEMVENYKDYPSKEEMAQSLTDRRIGYDFQKDKQYDWFKLAKKKKGMDLEKYWLAAKLTNNLGDISKIDKLPQCDLLTFSSPCTDYSIAGKQEGSLNTCNACGHKFNPFNYDVEERYNCPICGSDDIQGTRSGLLKEVERLLINSIKAGEAPKYLLQENVDALVSKKFKPDFEAFCRRLENLNYSVYWTVLNAKECGIPQNRRRLFMIGIRKDIDTGNFTFPIPFDAGLRLKDVLEKKVDEKYYINTERASNLIQQLVDKGQLKGCKEENKSILVKNQATEYSRTIESANTLMARDWKGFGNQDMVAIVESETLDTQKRLGGLWDSNTTHQAGSVWDKNGMSPTLDTAQGGGRMPHIIDDTTKPICVGNTTPSGKSQCNAVYSTDGVSQTLCAGTHGYSTGSILEEQKVNEIKQEHNDDNKIISTEDGVQYKKSTYRIRKLSVRECFALMGFEFSDWDKCSAIGISNSAGYKAAGNSIVTNCISLLFEHLYKAQYDETYICTDEKMQNFISPEAE
jgi:DNA (cytosine-5)-methyltransferase 1